VPVPDKRPLSAAGDGESPQTEAPQPTRRDLLGKTTVIAVFLLIGAVYLALVPRVWFVTPDATVYVGLARSLTRGEGYTFNLAPYGKYPPVFPVMLALVYATLGQNTWAMQLLVALCGVGALVATYALVRPRAGRWPALAVVLLTATCTWFCGHSLLYLLSGIPYAFFSLAALWLAGRELQSARFSVLRWLVVAALATVAIYTHLSGVALVPALALGILVGPAPQRTRRERWLAAGVVAGIGSLAAGYWVVRGWGLPHASSYGELVTAPMQDVGRIVEKTAQRLTEWTATPLSMKCRRVSWPFGLVCLGLFLVPGLVKAIRQSRDLTALYVCAYAAVMAVVGGRGGQERYVVPVLPLLFYFGYSSATILGEWVASALGKLGRGGRDAGSAHLWPRLVVLLLGLSVLGYAGSRWAKSRNAAGGFTAEGRAEAGSKLKVWQDVGRWAEVHVPRPATIATLSTGSWCYVHFFTERRVVVLQPGMGPDEALIRMVANQGSDFVFVDARRQTEARLLPVLRQHPECFTLISGDEQCSLYRVEKGRLRDLVAIPTVPDDHPKPIQCHAGHADLTTERGSIRP